MASMLRNLRFGLQTLLRNPGFAVISIATLALGIGANSAIFTVIKASLLDPLPWGEGRAVVLNAQNLQKNESYRQASVGEYLDWLEQLQSYDGLVAATGSGFSLSDGENFQMVGGSQTTPNAFALLGIGLELGRGLVPDDALPGAEPVVVLTHELWQDRYGGDPEIVGRRIEIDGERVTVVGVLPFEQWFPVPWSSLLMPLRVEQGENPRINRMLGVVGKLRPGVSLDTAQAELDVVMARLAEQYPETDEGWTARLDFAADQVVQGPGRIALWLVFGAVGFVLLIACGNVANLLLARAAGRHKEIATRAAVGASRSQIMLQLLSENGVLALAALPLAILVTRLALDFFLAQVPDTVTFMGQFYRLDGDVLLFTCATTLFTVLLFGLAPALYASKPDLSEGLKEGGERGSSGSRQRLRSVLVVGQIALALTLLSTSGLFIRSFSNRSSVDPGFEVENLLIAEIGLPEQSYSDPGQWRSFHRELMPALSAIPGVVKAGHINSAPFGFGGYTQDFHVRGEPEPDPSEVPRTVYSNVSVGYHDALGLRLVSGRMLDERDSETSLPVAVVNETLAKQYLGERALGKRIVVEEEQQQEFEVVGVVSDVAQWGLGQDQQAQLYVPYEQSPWRFLTIVLRTEREPISLAGAMRAAIRSVDPTVPVEDILTMEKRVERSLWQARFLVTVMAVLGGLALVLAAVGVYGVVSYATSLRTREFGIRSALGAEPAQIARLVLREAAILAGLGISIGLVLSAFVARGMQGILYDVSAFSPATYLGVALVLAFATLAASGVPAMRATRIDPMESLRVE